MTETERNEIMQYKNVPAIVAARVMGMSQRRLMLMLREGKYPFIGTACIDRSVPNAKWFYHISPGGIINYMDGKMLISAQENHE